MDLTVAIGDRLRRINIARHDQLSAAAPAKAERLLVTVDGRTHEVDVRQIGTDMLSLLLSTNGAARSIDVALAPLSAAGAFDVHIGGRRIPVQVQNGRRPGGSGGPAATGRGPLRVAAPMPGKIVRVLVKPGDDVRARQGLVVVEAMKMENELRAARDGRVRHVAVREGQSVDAGTVLVELEPVPGS